MKVKYLRTSHFTQEGKRFDLDKTSYDRVFFDQGVSGTIPFAERPEGSVLMKWVKKGLITQLITDEVSRLGRNTKDVLDVLYQNAFCIILFIIFVKKDHHDPIHQNDSACDRRRAPTTPTKSQKFLACATDSSDHQCATETPNRRTIGGLQYAFQTPYQAVVTGLSPTGSPDLWKSRTRGSKVWLLVPRRRKGLFRRLSATSDRRKDRHDWCDSSRLWSENRPESGQEHDLPALEASSLAPSRSSAGSSQKRSNTSRRL